MRYRTAMHVYLDGGRASDLAVGDRLLVQARGETVAELEVEFVADHSASCRVLSEKRPVQAGDVVTRAAAKRDAGPAAAVETPSGDTARPAANAEPSRAAPASAAPTPEAAPPAPARPVPWGRVRGALSLGYYKVADDTPSDFDFEQRTARFDLTVSEISGRPLTLSARLQSRQGVRARAFGPSTPRDERQDRVYELSLRYEPPSEGLRIEAGRIGISRFAGVGYVDGVLAEARVVSGLHLGAFGGVRADPLGVETGGLGPKYGTFVRLVPGGRWTRRWEVVVAAVREMAEDEVSREYFSIESRLRWGTRVDLVELAEIDWNRDWRRDASSGRAFQLSRLVMRLSTRLSQQASASLSYDNRRNYRSHHNRTVAEAIFDDLTRQGLRGSVSLGKGVGLIGTLGGGVRLRDRDDKNTYSAHGSLRHGSLFGAWLSAGVDGSAYQGAFGDGFMASARLGRRFESGHSLDLSYTYSLYRVGVDKEPHRTQWIRLSGRVELPRRVSVISDIEYDRGADLQGPRGSLELAYRF